MAAVAQGSGSVLAREAERTQARPCISTHPCRIVEWSVKNPREERKCPGKKGAGQKRLTPPLEMGFMVLVEGGMGRKGLGRCDATLGIAAAGGAGRVPRRKWAWWYEQRHEVGVLAAGRAGVARWRVGCVVAAVEADYVPRVKWA